MANEFIARNGLIAQNNSTITGSLTVSNTVGTVFSSNADTLVITGSAIITGSVIVTGSLITTDGITGSLQGTASYALTSSYSTNILGVNNYVPKFTGVNSIGTSSIYSGLYNRTGIATATPRNTLDVAGPVYANEVWTTYGFFLGDMDAGASYTYLSGDGVSSTNSYLTLATNAAERLRITHTGNVGIGTTTPNAKLNVNGNTIITGSLIVTGGITGSLQGTSSFSLTASFIDAGFY